MLCLALGQMSIVCADIAANYKTLCRYVECAVAQGAHIVVFPEMCLTGYWVGDLWECSSFLRRCEKYHEKIAELSQRIHIVFGSVGIDWEQKNEDGRVRKYSAIYHVYQGVFTKNLCTGYPFWIKTLSPNYGPFDDSRHFYDARKWSFSHGVPWTDLHTPLCLAHEGVTYRIGLSICEDGWPEHYGISPIVAVSENHQVHFCINISASPFVKNKIEERIATFSKQAQLARCPLLYVNGVGVQNIGKAVYAWDGSSMAFSGEGNLVWQGKSFAEELLLCVYQQGTWQGTEHYTIPKRPSVLEALEFIVSQCCQQWNIPRVVIGVSGGVDSAVGATLFSRVLGPQNVALINMPTVFNAQETQGAAKQLAKNLGCYYESISITDSIELTKKQVHSFVTQQNITVPSLVWENVQARDRGSRLLAALASTWGGAVPCNANKSEMTVGYCTLYGDQVGFLSPLGDLWKHEIYALAHKYNKDIFGGEVIPSFTLTVVPSAELSADQDVLKNQGDPLHYPYHDFLFRSWVEHKDRKTPEDNLQAYLGHCLDAQLGCPEGTVDSYFSTASAFVADLQRWWKQYKGMGAFKRLQAPPVVALSTRVLGGDHREHVGCVPLFAEQCDGIFEPGYFVVT